MSSEFSPPSSPSPPLPPLSIILWLIKFWTNVLAGFAAIATILSFAGRKWWVFALMEHPRVQYSLILLIALFVSLFTSKKRINIWNILCTVTLSINLILIFPLFIPPQQTLNQASNAPQQTIRVIHATLDSK